MVRDLVAVRHGQMTGHGDAHLGVEPVDAVDRALDRLTRGDDRTDVGAGFDDDTGGKRNCARRNCKIDISCACGNEDGRRRRNDIGITADESNCGAARRCSTLQCHRGIDRRPANHALVTQTQTVENRKNTERTLSPTIGETGK